ncbi:MAG: hypothetical protein H5T86_13605 [Armatimonadetes bacterium]|nr:hypothetical protein [Armatimonadota bacterium]
MPRLKLEYAAGAVVAALAFSRARCPERSYDIWWHLATGRWIVEHRAIPNAEPFSYTATGAPWVAHEWLADIGLYLVYRSAGHHGLALVRQSIAAATCIALYSLVLLFGAHPLLAAAGAAALLIFLAPVTNARPQFLLPLLTLAVLHALYRHRLGQRQAIWAVPIIALLWANLHGGFIVLYAVLCIYLLDCLARAFALPSRKGNLSLAPVADVLAVSGVTGIATLANPYGFEGALYPVRYVVGDLRWTTRAVTEYASPDFGKAPMNLAGLFIVALLGVFAWSRRPVELLDGLLLLFFLHGYLKWQRMVGVFGAVAIGVLCRHLAGAARLQRTSHRESQVLNIAFVIVALLFLVTGWPWLVPESALVSHTAYPVRTLEVALLNGIRGNLLNTYHFGGYIIWRSYPQRIVFIDGRADAYPKRIFDDSWLMLHGEPGWEAKLRQYDIAWAVLDRTQPLAKILRVMPGWHVVCGDNASLLLVRDGAPNESFLRRWRSGKLLLPPAETYAR